MIEESEAEDESTFAIDGDKAAIANSTDEMDQSRFELLLTTPGGRIRVRCFRIRTCLSFLYCNIGAERSVLDSVAVIGEWVLTLSVVLFHAGEIHVCRLDEILSRHT